VRGLIFLLSALLVVSALALVSVRHLYRLDFIALRDLQKEHDTLQVEWRQLLVENRTLALHRRVEATARKELNMRVPAPERMVVVDLR